MQAKNQSTARTRSWKRASATAVTISALALAGCLGASTAHAAQPALGWPASNPAGPAFFSDIPPVGATGMDGTAPWQLTPDGKLTIGAGQMTERYDGVTWREYRQDITVIEFSDPTATKFPDDSTDLFASLPKLVEFRGIGSIDTSNVHTFTSMFSSLSSLTGLDIAGWTTSSATNMNFMFMQTTKLTSLDLSNWDVRNVETFNGMFNSAYRLTSLNVSGWTPSSATSMAGMFMYMSELTSLDLSGWDVGNLVDTSSMFAYSPRLRSLDLSGWDTSNVRTTDGAFLYASLLSQISLGAKTSLALDDELRTLPQDAQFTGNWVTVGAGTTSVPQGPWSGDSAALLAHSRTGNGAGTYILQQFTNLKFDGTGGTGAVSDVPGATGVAAVLPANGFTKTGYTFTGWNTNADGTGKMLNPGAELYLPGGDTTFYAQWKSTDSGTTPPGGNPTTPPGGNTTNPGLVNGKPLSKTGATDTTPYAIGALLTLLAGAGALLIGRRLKNEQ